MHGLMDMLLGLVPVLKRCLSDLFINLSDKSYSRGNRLNPD